MQNRYICYETIVPKPVQAAACAGFQQSPKFSTTPCRFLSGCEDGFVFEFEGVSESGSEFGLVLVSVWSVSGAVDVVVFVYGMQIDAFAFSDRRSAF